MLRIIVTGKPSKWTAVKKVDGSKVVAKFVLTERRWVGGQTVEIVWTCCVPAHKETWAKAQVDKGYTLAVEASDMCHCVHTDVTPFIVEQMLMVTEVTGL